MHYWSLLELHCLIGLGLRPCSPVLWGGLTIREACLHAPAAFVSALVQSSHLVHHILGRAPETSSHLAPTIIALAKHSIDDMDVPLRQKVLSHSTDQANYAILVDSAPDSRFRALALFSAISHAGDWLSVVPSHALGLHLLDWEFRLCLQYWLGLQMVEVNTPCPVCQVISDPYGDHQVGCGGNGDRIHRHDSIRGALFSAAQSAALAPRKEVPALIPGISSRPADIYLPNWKRGQPAALDVTVISTLQQQTVEGASDSQGHALTVGRERKLAAHSGACRSVGVHFIPLVVESLGGWDGEAAATIRSIG